MKGYDIFRVFIELGISPKGFEWVDDFDDFSILSCIILGQSTRWENALLAHDGLKAAGICDIDALLALDFIQLASLIRPCGFYRQKAKKLHLLCFNIKKDFKSLSIFKKEASEQWLLGQNGVGHESCDSILNFLCKQAVLPVGSYFASLGAALGYECFDYLDLRSFYQAGIEENQAKLNQVLGSKYELYQLYVYFHAQLTNYAKANIKKKVLAPSEAKKILNML